MGSVVLEQILRVCPTVKRIYVLIRDKKGQSGELLSSVRHELQNLSQVSWGNQSTVASKCETVKEF